MSWNAVKKASAGVLAVPLAASMLLAACGGDAKPAASPSSTTGASVTTTAAPSSPTPTTSLTATVAPSATADPNIPAAARAHTPAGAEAFVRYFIDRLNVAWTVPRAGILSPMCQASSKNCAAYERDATRLVNEGHRYDGNPVTISFVGTLDATNPLKYDVLANLVQERRNEIDNAGKIYVTDERKNVRLNFGLLYTGQAWSISSIQIMK